jgi:uncharacterized membrane protein
MFPFLQRFRWIGAATLIAGYALLVHHVNVAGRPSLLGAALALLPVFGFGFALAANVASRWAGVAVMGGGAWLAGQWWPLIASHTGVLFYLQDVCLVLVLAMGFGRSLLPGQKPLCVGFAEMLQGGELAADHERYARRVTVAWMLYFVLLALVSTLLFFLAPLPVWSFYANFLVLPLIGLMFVGEFLVRRLVLPQAAKGGAFDGLRAYLKSH